MKLNTDAFLSKTQLRDIMEVILNNQNTLNTQAYDSAWIGHAKSGKFDYPLATGHEIVEFSNSWNQWCWWSKSVPNEHDMLNMKIECVDALHFILSSLIAENTDSNGNNDIPVLADRVSDFLVLAQINTPILESEDAKKSYEKSLIKQLLIYAGGGGGGQQSEYAVYNLYRLVISACNMGFKQFSTMYLAKSVLNRFRQENGYREKKYRKMWTLKLEDNHVMMQWISKQATPPSEEQIKEFLASEYREVLSHQ